jgi:hypothetical protein
MSEVENVEGWIAELHRYAQPRASGDSRPPFTDEQAIELSKRLQAGVKTAETDAEKGLLASMMLRPEHGLLEFLKITTDPDNSQGRSKCRETVLRALGELVEIVGDRIGSGRGTAMMVLCFRIFENDSKAVKLQALEPMKQLLQSEIPGLEQELAKISTTNPHGRSMKKMIEAVVRQFISGGKATHSQTLKGNMLLLLSIWARKYNKVLTSDMQKHLAKVSKNALETQYKNWMREGKNGTDFIIIDGAISLVSALLRCPMCSLIVAV